MKRSIEALVVIPMVLVIAAMAILGVCGIARAEPFLSRGTVPGAVAAFTIIGAADEHSAIVQRYPVVAGVHAVVSSRSSATS